MDGTTVDTSFLTAYLPWFAVACIGALAVALTLAISSLRRLQVELEEKSTQATRLDRVLSQAVEGALVLVHPADSDDLDATEATCSRRLAVLLSLPQGEAASFEDVFAALSKKSAKALYKRIQILMQVGDAFSLQIDAPDCGRMLQATGMRADEYTAGRMTSVVWFSDISRQLDAEKTTSEELATLQHDRSRYRAALDAVPVPIWLRDDDLDLTFCNSAYARAVGAHDPMQARKDSLEILKGSDGREGRSLAARARASGTSRDAHEVIALGGVLRHFDIRETPLFPHGATAVMASEIPELRGTVGVALDVTAHHSVKTELVRHDEAHALVLERLGTAMVVFASDQRLQFYNTAFERLWQLDREWLDSEPDYGTLLEVLRDRRQLPEVANFPAYKAEELAAFTDLLEPIESLMHLPGGATLRRVISPHPLGGLLLTYEDVTDTLALERSYNTLIDVQAETLNHLQEAVAVFDGTGVLRLSNAAFATLWDLPEVRPQPGGTEATGNALRFHEVVDFQSNFLSDANARNAFSASMANVRHQRQLQTGVLPHIDFGPVQWQAAPVADGGLVLSYARVSAGGDGTLPHADIAAMLAGAMQSIAGWGDVLAHGHYGELNPRQKAYVESICDNAAAIDRVLLAAEELGDGTAKTATAETVDVHMALSHVLASVRDRAQRREVELYFDCVPDIGRHRLWKEGFQRLMGMMFDMALASTSATDSMSLAAQRDAGGGLTITLADVGAGWDVPNSADGTETKAVDRAASARFAVIRAYAETQGWRFDLVTVPGEGTTVTLSRDRD